MSEEKRATTSTTRLRVREGILEVLHREGAELDLKAAKELFRAVRNLTEEPLPQLIEAEQEVIITPTAREFFRRVEGLNPLPKIAVVTASLHYRLLADFYKNYHQPETFFRVFRDREEALSWLREGK